MRSRAVLAATLFPISCRVAHGDPPPRGRPNSRPRIVDQLHARQPGHEYDINLRFEIDPCYGRSSDARWYLRLTDHREDDTIHLESRPEMPHHLEFLIPVHFLSRPGCSPPTERRQPPRERPDVPRPVFSSRMAGLHPKLLDVGILGPVKRCKHPVDRLAQAPCPLSRLLRTGPDSLPVCEILPIAPFSLERYTREPTAANQEIIEIFLHRPQDHRRETLFLLGGLPVANALDRLGSCLIGSLGRVGPPGLFRSQQRFGRWAGRVGGAQDTAASF